MEPRYKKVLSSGDTVYKECHQLRQVGLFNGFRVNGCYKISVKEGSQLFYRQGSQVRQEESISGLGAG